MGPFARGKTSSLPNVIAANSPRWDENRNRGKDESNRKPRGIRRGNALACVAGGIVGARENFNSRAPTIPPATQASNASVKIQ